MSFCAGDTQGLSETSKQFPEGVGEAEAGSLNCPEWPKVGSVDSLWPAGRSALLGH